MFVDSNILFLLVVFWFHSDFFLLLLFKQKASALNEKKIVTQFHLICCYFWGDYNSSLSLKTLFRSSKVAGFRIVFGDAINSIYCFVELVT